MTAVNPEQPQVAAQQRVDAAVAQNQVKFGKNAGRVLTHLNYLQIPMKVVSDPDWETATYTYNARIPCDPAVIVIPETTEDICGAVKSAARFGVKVQAKSGGHSYASYSMGGWSGCMAIDLRNFNKLESLDSQGIAKVGGGMRLGDLADAIWNQGKCAIAHGTCPTVGIGGHATHGGFGWFSRAWGLTLDQIVAMDVVTANGNLVHACQTQNSDLYFAMRGAADSFGIVAYFYFQTQAAPESVVNWSIDFNNLATDVDESLRVLKHVQELGHNAKVVDRNLGLGVALAAGRLSVTGGYLGSTEKFTTSIMPELLQGLPQPTGFTIEPTSWIDHLAKVGNVTTLKTEGPYERGEKFFAKSVVSPEPGFPEASLRSYLNFVVGTYRNPAPVEWYAIFDLYGGADSQIQAKDGNFAAYGHRDAMWVVQNYGCVYAKSGVAQDFPEAGIKFVQDLNSSLAKGLGKWGAYGNYVDPSLVPAEAHKLYYGTVLYEKLQKLKKRLDPQNVFANPQSVALPELAELPFE